MEKFKSENEDLKERMKKLVDVFKQIETKEKESLKESEQLKYSNITISDDLTACK